VTVIVEVVELPAAVVAEAGAALKLKSFTAKVYVVVRFCPPEAPVTVTVYVPVGVAVVVATVNVEVAVPFAAGVTDVKLNPQVTVAFTGAIAQVKATAELKLFKDVTVIVEVVEFPIVVVADAGEALKLKSYTVNA
jgi:hypothetical protein